MRPAQQPPKTWNTPMGKKERSICEIFEFGLLLQIAVPRFFDKISRDGLLDGQERKGVQGAQGLIATIRRSREAQEEAGT